MHFISDRYFKTSHTKDELKLTYRPVSMVDFVQRVVNHPPFCISEIIIQLIIFGNFAKIYFFLWYYHTRHKYFISGDRENKYTRNFTIRKNKSTRGMAKFASAKIKLQESSCKNAKNNILVLVRHEIALFWSF